jgi:hypothetical protein
MFRPQLLPFSQFASQPVAHPTRHVPHVQVSGLFTYPSVQQGEHCVAQSASHAPHAPSVPSCSPRQTPLA